MNYEELYEGADLSANTNAATLVDLAVRKLADIMSQNGECEQLSMSDVAFRLYVLKAASNSLAGDEKFRAFVERVEQHSHDACANNAD